MLNVATGNLLGHETGANASAGLHSLIETAKSNGFEPYAYLRAVFSEFPQATSVDEIEELLPVPNDSSGLAQVSLSNQHGSETRP